LTPAFVHTLDHFGSAVALVNAHGETRSYARLVAEADDFAAQLVGATGFVLIECRNSIATVTAMLGAWRAGLPVLLTKADDGEGTARLIDTYRPAWVVRQTGGGTALERGAEQPAAVHPDLALLLSTSGTTGATKLVRLSDGNVDANARSIGAYLGIRPDDRAITSLPLHYSYGLSVLNSHLAAGAALVLTERSAIEPEFRSLCETAGVTSIAGVPFTYELLERSDFVDWAPASLRTMTQAGGRLPAETAERFGAWMAGRGGRFFVMYGQTEATARMAFVDPATLLAKPGIIGKAIPGGEFSLVGDDGMPVAAPHVEGELVYRGPNVMMGYGEEAADLLRGSELAELRTGDLAMVDEDGDYRLVGRKQRFVKPFGLRVSLDAIEERLAAVGVTAMVTGDDALIAVALRGAASADDVRSQLADWFNLPEQLFDVAELTEFPVLANGKRDYRAVLEAAKRRQADAPPASEAGFLDLFRNAFPRKHVMAGDSFVSLSGDSLNYILIAAEIEHRLGALPDDWQDITIADLDARLAVGGEQPRSLVTRVDSEIALRAVAITAVVINHASDFPVGGGVDALFILVGFNLARFQFGAFTQGHFWSVVARFVPRVLVPYYVLMVAYALVGRPVSGASWLLVSNISGRFSSVLEPYWFIEALLQCLLIMALISSSGPLRRMASETPFRFALLLLGVAVVAKSVVPQLVDESQLWGRTPDQVFVLVAFGWAICLARTPGQRAAMLGVAAVMAVAQWSSLAEGFRPFVGSGLRGVWVLAATILLLYVRRIIVFPWLRKLLVALSAASFSIYLLHNIVIYLTYASSPNASPWIAIAAGIATGVAAHFGWLRFWRGAGWLRAKRGVAATA
jgi:acyl-CoA synthetase (AMP-forming)/AMP-acid ligase II/peptidoglycan/LPS O-acetylase OafA/YrhL